MKLYRFQEQAIKALQDGKHFCIAGVGSGKGSIALHWAHDTGKPNILVVSTASKRDVKDQLGRNDFEAEADAWFGEEWRQSLSSFSVISWQGLSKWLKSHEQEIPQFAFIFDEVACAKAGVSSIRGKAFLKITAQTSCWTGYTATPGDKWLDFYAYFVACRKVRNKTQFTRDFCKIQTFKGFPEIVGYYQTETLKKWWHEIADIVDTSQMLKELPEATHKVVYFKAPTDYKKIIKTRYNRDGEFLDTIMGLCHYLRQISITDEKIQWVKDFAENLGEQAVIFYNYKEEGDRLEAALKSVLPKGAKVWRIDGAHHDIPTAETIGKYDFVLTQWASGSMGLNLQFMRYWVSCSPNYSWSISEQGRGRIKRIGQKNTMFFFYLETLGTIEEQIYKCLRNKSDFQEDLWAVEMGMEPDI